MQVDEEMLIGNWLKKWC